MAATTAAVGVGIGSAVMLMIGFGQQPDRIVLPEAAPLVGALVIGLLSATATKPLLTAAARSTPDAPR